MRLRLSLLATLFAAASAATAPATPRMDAKHGAGPDAAPFPANGADMAGVAGNAPKDAAPVVPDTFGAGDPHDGRKPNHRVFEDPFWVDAPNCDDGAADDAAKYKAPAHMAKLTKNLIRNGGPDAPSMTGWFDIVNGGDGWKAEKDAFKTSFRANTRRQIVPLVVDGSRPGNLHGVNPTALDSGMISIAVSEEITETFSRDKFYIRAALCSDPECTHKIARWAPCKCSTATLDTTCSLEPSAYCVTRGSADGELGHLKPGEHDRDKDDVWRTLGYTFSGDEVKGARYLLFEDGGCSGEYWKGLFGPWFRHASVVLYSNGENFEPARTPPSSGNHAWALVVLFVLPILIIRLFWHQTIKIWARVRRGGDYEQISLVEPSGAEGTGLEFEEKASSLARGEMIRL